MTGLLTPTSNFAEHAPAQALDRAARPAPLSYDSRVNTSGEKVSPGYCISAGPYLDDA